MKKIKAFTLLEMILVITIIWIISASLIKMKDNTWNKNDVGREAVNVIYKEMNQYVKDFQRNKIWEDLSAEYQLGNEHEITYLYLNFNDEDVLGKTKWEELTIWNLYLYTITWMNDEGTPIPILTWHLDWTSLISNLKYSAFQVVKWSDNYTFFIRNESRSPVSSILISNNWKIYAGDFHDIKNNNFTIDEENNLTIDDENNLNLSENYIYKFLICWWYWQINPIWIISINAISKTATLERCESEKYAGIKCEEFASCQ